MGSAVLSSVRLVTASRDIVIVYADPAEVFADRLLSVFDGRIPSRMIAAGDALPVGDDLVERHPDLFVGEVIE